jgi:hypothetical protein
MKIINLENIDEQNDTIRDVKVKLSEILKVDVTNDYLFYNKERLMNDSIKISDLDIKPSERILLVKNYTKVF